ncbi:hypothetical protein GINT2_000259 [Glugoides intestinalis]
MDIQTKPIFKARSPRVKCIASHKNYDKFVVGLFTGELQVYDSKSHALYKSIKLCDVPIRTVAIVPSKDWILAGNDEGSMLVLNLGNLTTIEIVKVHDDFVRKIVVDEKNQRLLTVSDDNRTKLWSFSNGILLINKYKNSKHFVMDASFYPSDPNYFFTVSLDKKVRMYSVSSTKLLKAYKGHENGINTITFIGKETFITGADDCNLLVWDTNRLAPIAVLKGHTKGVTSVCSLKVGFASCSEDNTVRIWDNDFKTTCILSLQGRVWDLYMKDEKLIVGGDEELCVFQETKAVSTAIMKENKIFYNQGRTVYSVKNDEIGAYKELGTVDEEIENFTVNPNGKLIGTTGGNEVNVFSTLGMRKKYTDSGKDIHFIDVDRFVYVKEASLVFVSKNNVESTVKIPELTKILFADSQWIILNTKRTAIYNIKEEPHLVHEFDRLVHKAIIVDRHTVLFDKQVHIFDSEFEEIETLDSAVENILVQESVLYFSTANRSFYMLFGEGKTHLSNMKNYGLIIGVKEDKIYYYLDGVKSDTLDIDLIKFKKDFFKGLEPEPKVGLEDKVISFFESLGLHEKALAQCTDENQRFDILLKLGRLEDAQDNANSQIKYMKLGKGFLGIGDCRKAADCFFKAGDLSSLLLADTFGEKKYFEYVGKKSKETGKNNLAFLAAYKQGNYEMCKDLLKDTVYANCFDEFYCNVK